MRTSIILLLTATLTLSACGAVRDSRINPFNWFGGSRAESLPATENTNPLIPERSGVFARRPEAPYAGVRVAVIDDLTIERSPGGAIIRVRGTAAKQGAHEVRLVKEDDESDATTLTYTLKAQFPQGSRRVGPATSRELTAARFVTSNDLAGIRTIRVKGAQNARSSSRR